MEKLHLTPSTLSPVIVQSSPSPDILQVLQGDAPHMHDSASSSQSSSLHSVTTIQPAPQPKPLQRIHHMVLQHHRHAHNVSIFTIEPTSFQVANNNLVWCTTMIEELNALHKIQTWMLVPKTLEMNIVGNKWVFRVKTHVDGSLAQYKASLVATGYHPNNLGWTIQKLSVRSLNRRLLD